MNDLGVVGDYGSMSDGVEHSPAMHWRKKKQYLGLVGGGCPHCEHKIFPPKRVCPNCGGMIHGALVAVASAQSSENVGLPLVVLGNTSVAE